MTLLSVTIGCKRATPASTETADAAKRPALATVYPLAAVLRQVTGDGFNIHWFCEAPQDPRDLKLTPDQADLAHRVDFIITSGFGETWAGNELTAQVKAQRLIQPELMPSARALPPDEDHGALWLDPQIVKELVEEIRQRATILDTRREQAYRANADALQKELTDLDAEYRRRLGPYQGRAFISLRPTWGLLASRYGLTEVAPANATPQSLTDADVKAIKKAAKDNATDLLVIDAAFLPGVQRELALRTGLKLVPLDPLGTSAPDGRSTYVRLMQYNLDQLEKALK